MTTRTWPVTLAGFAETTASISKVPSKGPLHV